MEIRRMRDCIISIYGAEVRNRRVNDMHPSQVIAIYNRLKSNNFEKGGKKKEKEQQRIQEKKTGQPAPLYHQYNIFEYVDKQEECEKKYPYKYDPETKEGVIGQARMDFRSQKDYERVLGDFREKYIMETF